MKVEQLPSGTFRVRIMIDGHRYTFTDKDKKRVKAMAASFADEHREAVENPTLQAAMEKYIEGRSKSRSESTIRGYDTIYRMMLDRYPDLCQKRVTNIRQTDLQNVVDTMDREPKTISQDAEPHWARRRLYIPLYSSLLRLYSSRQWTPGCIHNGTRRMVNS